jgi:putative membrane protein
MMTERFTSSPLNLLRWQQQNATFYALVAAGAWLLIRPLGLTWLELPVMPITVVGAAIGIFASFRANQAYDRWWEGRRLWGGLVNSSRHFADQVRSYVGKRHPELAERLTVRHIAYVHTLRCLLRSEDPFADPDLRRVLHPDDHNLRGSTTLTHALLDKQLEALVDLADAGQLNEHRLESFDRTLMDLLNLQGGCERIKGTPLPRGFGFIIELLIQGFAVMLPFALVHDVGIMAVPLNVVVCLSFALISEAGRVLEDPFGTFYNGLPLSALSIKIERDLRQRRGEAVLPDVVQEGPVGVLL